MRTTHMIILRFPRNYKSKQGMMPFTATVSAEAGRHLFQSEIAQSAGLSISTRDQLSFVKPQSREKEMFRRFPPVLTTGRADGEVMMATGTRE